MRVRVDPKTDETDKPDETIFERPEYWNGDLGYRAPGYHDFPVNELKADYIVFHQPDSVLDVGAAYGYIVQRLRKRGIKAWGIDISRYALSRAPDDVASFLRRASAADIPFSDDTFDMAVSFSTLEHLDPDIVHQVVKEITRVSTRGIISVTPSTDPNFDDDITHRTKKPLKWWRSLFPDEYQVRGDSDEKWKKALQ